jgi:predicted DNA-binding WGR domain protein
MHRWYAIHLQQELWGGVSLVCQWGRLGQAGGARRVFIFDSMATAQAAAERLLRRRLRRGYILRHSSGRMRPTNRAYLQLQGRETLQPWKHIKP